MIHTEKGYVSFTFDNGYRASIGNRDTHYCSRGEKQERGDQRKTDTAEIACLDSNDHFTRNVPGFEAAFEESCDDVIGHIPADRVADFIYAVSKI